MYSRLLFTLNLFYCYRIRSKGSFLLVSMVLKRTSTLLQVFFLTNGLPQNLRRWTECITTERFFRNKFNFKALIPNIDQNFLTLFLRSLIHHNRFRNSINLLLSNINHTGITSRSGAPSVYFYKLSSPTCLIFLRLNKVCFWSKLYR